MRKYLIILFIIFLYSCTKHVPPQSPKLNYDSLSNVAINKTINQLIDSGYIK